MALLEIEGARPGAERYAGAWGMAFRRLRRNRAASISAVVILGFVLVAVFADLISPYGPYEQFLRRGSEAVVDPMARAGNGKFEAPSTTHFFGTDELARDIFSRTLI